MIGLDTNVVIRYLTQDDPVQSKLANQLIEKVLQRKETLLINQVTLCEIIWVLEKCYEIDKSSLIQILKQLLATENLIIEKDDIVWQALHEFEQKNSVGFTDCLIGRSNIFQHCTITYTFDKGAAKQLPSTFAIVPR